MDPVTWAAYPVAFLLVAGLALVFRWLVLLSRQVNALAERVAWLEGRLDHRPDDEQGPG